MKGQSQQLKQPYSWLNYLELPVLTAIFIIVAINLPYKSFGLITTITVVLLGVIRAYIKWRYQVTVPWLILLFTFLSIEIDAFGNLLNLYQTMKEPVPYDVFAHFTIPMLSAPVIIWLFATGIEKFEYSLPLGVIAFFSVTINFFLSGFYEVVELWDELFFHGKRIWTLHDTSNDLQWGLLGSIVGAIATYLILRQRRENSIH
ncbi:MAG: hypothetical protein JST84_16720 [Acidobacteria bacterium]|nr:hypothetical protein [Acidobacteriota bacterium]